MMQLQEDDLNDTAGTVLTVLEDYMAEDEAKRALLDILQLCGGQVCYLSGYKAVMQKVGRRRAKVLLARGEDRMDVMRKTDLSMKTIRRIEDELDTELNATD